MSWWNLALVVVLAAAAGVGWWWMWRMYNERDAAREAARASRQALREQSQLVAGVVHDLRHPLAGLHATAQSLRTPERFAPSQLREVFAALADETLVAESLTTDLLLATSALGSTQLVAEEVDLVDLAWQVSAAWRRVHPGREISVDAPGTAYVTTPPRWPRRIVDNLLSNALTHSPEGSPVHIEVRCSHGMTVLRVRNTAPTGLAPEMMASGAMASGAVSSGTRGTGIGLYTVRALVTSLGGRLDHQVDRSSSRVTFTVTLPTGLAQLEDAAGPAGVRGNLDTFPLLSATGQDGAEESAPDGTDPGTGDGPGQAPPSSVLRSAAEVLPAAFRNRR